MIYLDVGLCVTEEAKKCVCSQYLYLFKTLWCLFQKLTTEMNLSYKVHSAWKHNISGLLEIIEIHKYTSQWAQSMKSVSTAFWYKFVLFCPFRIKWGLTFQHANIMIWPWRSQHVEACFHFYPMIFIWRRFQPIICLIRDLMALDAMLLRPNKDSRAGIFLGQFSRTPKRRTNECPAWGRTGGLKSGLSGQNPDVWPPYLLHIYTHKYILHRGNLE